jgi:hypothetical protein
MQDMSLFKAGNKILLLVFAQKRNGVAIANLYGPQGLVVVPK